MNTKYFILLILNLLFCAQPALAELVGVYCNLTKSPASFSGKATQIPPIEAKDRVGQSFRIGDYTFFYFRVPTDSSKPITGFDGAGHQYTISKEVNGYKMVMEKSLIVNAPSKTTEHYNQKYYTPIGNPLYKGTPVVKYAYDPKTRFPEGNETIIYTLDVRDFNKWESLTQQEWNDIVTRQQNVDKI